MTVIAVHPDPASVELHMEVGGPAFCWPLVPVRAPEEDAAPATRFSFADGRGEIGVMINSVTDPFCGSCNRLRITADGAVRNCLFARREWSLRDAMRRAAPTGSTAEGPPPESSDNHSASGRMPVDA